MAIAQVAIGNTDTILLTAAQYKLCNYDNYGCKS